MIKIEDIKTFNLCMWKTLITDFFESAENYLKNGIGFILWDSKPDSFAVRNTIIKFYQLPINLR